MSTVLIIGASRGIGLETVTLALSEAGKSSMSHAAVSGVGHSAI
jgi:NAD(P)-dependent dehydrogenase (short-subunit alcohol dehydrogenase family)